MSARGSGMAQDADEPVTERPSVVFGVDQDRVAEHDPHSVGRRSNRLATLKSVILQNRPRSGDVVALGKRWAWLRQPDSQIHRVPEEYE
jgi:hypothetical protein